MSRLPAAFLVAIGLAALAAPFATVPSRKVLTAHETRLPLYFPHEKHEGVTCLTCHHTVLGMTQTIPCVACHRMEHPAIKLSAEPRFHQFCRGCHEEKSRQGLARGPVRDCAACHRPAE